MTTDGPTRTHHPPAARTSGLGGLSLGDEVDRYRVLTRLGRGGFGQVYEAEQLRPVVRRVALKVLRPDVADARVIARFETERQTLALLDHSNIAKVYDAGLTAQGLPYFVMELVRGEPITDAADRNRLTIDERLKLFAAVCRGVSHAHDRGVLHRDLKPQNILVTYQDREPTPKIIDFGIAKVWAGPLASGEALTQRGHPMGTLEFMSPEQALGDHARVDVRSDVYSLGVVLYQLLVGLLPHGPEEFRDRPLADIQSLLRDQYVQSPSARLSSATDLIESIARSRQTEARVLLGTLRADLQDIALSALQKNPDLRYQSCRDLADDIDRYRTGLPLRPMPMRSRSVAYTLGKWVDRHQLVSRIQTVLIAAAGVQIAICVAAAALVAVDWAGGLGLFGRYVAGDLNGQVLVASNLAGAVAAGVLLWSAHGVARCNLWQMSIAVAVCLGGWVWACTLFFDVFEHDFGGLLRDDRFRRTFALIYLAAYTQLGLVALAAIPSVLMTRRYGRPGRRERA